MNRRTFAQSLAAATPAALAQPADAPRIGIIGCGNRSRVHLEALRQLHAQVVALSDINSAQMQRGNQALPTRAAEYTDYRELLKDRNVTLVVIATPNFLHSEMAIAALRAGKDVLVEKPLAATFSQARQLQHEALQSKNILAVGMQRRFARIDRQVQLIVDSGVLGKVHLASATDWRGDWNPASWQFTDPYSRVKTNWRFRRDTAGSSELEMSVHTFAQIVSIVQSPLARVWASGAVQHHPGRETRDISTAVIEFENGFRFLYSLCLFSKSAGPGFALTGDQGTLLVEGGRVLVNGKEVPEYERMNPMPEVEMYRELFDAVAKRRRPAVHADLAMEACRIAFAIDLSIRHGRAITPGEIT